MTLSRTIKRLGLVSTPSASSAFQARADASGHKASSDEDFTWVDAASEEAFESITAPPKDSEEDDFFLVAEAAGRRSVQQRHIEALPQPVAQLVEGAVAGAKRSIKQVAQTPQLTLKASSVAFQAVTTESINSNPLLPQTYNPTRYLATAGAAFGATILGISVKQAQGIEGIDHEETIRAAEMHLRRGASVFSTEQKTIVRQWILEARAGLRAFSGAPAPAPDAAAGVEGAARMPTQPRAPYQKASRPMTFGRLLDDATKASESVNPDRATLLARQPELAHVLQAREQFVHMPYVIHKTTRLDVLQRFHQDRVMGSRDFIDSLLMRGNILADNSHKEAVEQNKKIMIAISGPGTGTGKTTNIKKMAAWLNQPICMLSGEEFCSMAILEGSDAYSVVVLWVQSRVTEHMQINGVGGVNGLLLLDDFHFALEQVGPFSADATSRGKFFNFLKCIGDANQESIISAKELAPGRFFPLNLSRIQVFVSLNRLPKELSEHGEVALTSRSITLNVAYPNDQDRQAIAFDHAGANLKAAIAEHYGCSPGEVASRLNRQVYTESLLALAAIDIGFARSYDGKLGFRAFKDLLDRYEQHVKSKLGAQHSTFDPDIFAFDGPTPFDSAAVAEEIKDYRKGKDADLARTEETTQMARRIGAITIEVDKLPGQQAQTLKQLIDDASRASLSARPQLLNAIEDQVRYYRDRVPLPEAQAFGRALREQFGYLRSQGTSEETDRFESIANVAEELYIRRAATTTLGYRSNKLVRVKFIDPQAADPSIYSDIAQLLGGVPVHFLTHPDHLLKIHAPSPVVSKLSVPIGVFERDYPVDFNGAMMFSYMRKHMAGQNQYMYFRSDRPDDAGQYTTYFLSEETLSHLSQGLATTISASTPGVVVVKGSAQVAEEVANSLLPRLSFIDDYLAKTTEKRSVAEPFIIAWVDKEVSKRMQQWRHAQPNLPADRSTRDLFEHYLYQQLNQAKFTLQDGTSFDPRALTLFLLDDSLHNTAGLKPNNDVATVMTVRIAPVHGRKARATHTLDQALQNVNKEAADNAVLFSRSATNPIALDDAEQAIFEALVAWDAQVAMRPRELNQSVPTSLLDTGVINLVRRAADRQTDYFGLNDAQALPHVSAFEAEWSELYRLPLEAIESALLRRADESQKAQDRAARRAEASKTQTSRSRGLTRRAGRPSPTPSISPPASMLGDIASQSEDESEDDERASELEHT